MASSGNTWQKKLMAKAKRHALRQRLGTMTPLLARSKSTFAEKQVVYSQFQRMNAEHAINPGPMFDGAGLPDETIKPSKTTAEKAEKDTRPSLKAEWREGFKPRRFGKRGRTSGCFYRQA